MIVRIKTELSNGEKIVSEFMREFDKLTNYPTPDLNEPATGIIDAIDKFNYGLLSKTEFTEYLYRHMGSATKNLVYGLENLGEAFIEHGPNGVIELLF